MKTLIHNIHTLAGIDRSNTKIRCGEQMRIFKCLHNAWLMIEDERIADFGIGELPQITLDGREIGEMTLVDAEGGTVLPSFCDSHTHIVYADSRHGEFVDKIRGLSYEEIARRGGGILNSADRLHELSEDELYRQAMKRVDEIIAKGTGAVEIKSGYGLSTEDELKMLRVIRRIKDTSPLIVRSTFLGAHAVPRNFIGRQSDYVNLLINETIPEVGRQKMADFIDVFCDRGFFTPEETSSLLEAGEKWGMRPKIHGQELADSGGVEVAVKHNALSVDHLESMMDQDIELLKTHTATMPTALPGTSFFLNMPFAPARKMIDAGLAMAIASDYNPGSTPSGDMKFCISLACIKMRLLPEEAFNAATINSATAMDITDIAGSIAIGKTANFFITQPIPDLSFIPYSYTSPVISQVWLKGKQISL